MLVLRFRNNRFGVARGKDVIRKMLDIGMSQYALWRPNLASLVAKTNEKAALSGSRHS